MSELTAGLSAADVRSSPEQMRTALRRLASAGTTWTGAMPDVVEALFEVARVDLCLARLTEGHCDGLRILEQAGRAPRDGVYGVWASRSAGTGVKAHRHREGWQLTGELRFASGVDLVDRALLPGWLDEDHHDLFDIAAAALRPDYGSWSTSAMDASRSFSGVVDELCTNDDRVGATNFYLHRPGFVVGGLCVAAVWAGGAQQLVDLVTTSSRAFTPSAHQLRRIGILEQAAWQARTAVRHVAARIERSDEEDVARLVAQARLAVVTAADQVVDETAKVVGPGGLSRDVRLARTLADLGIYLRQHHGDGELERLGRQALTAHDVLG